MSGPFGSGMPPLPNSNASPKYPAYSEQTNHPMNPMSPYPTQPMSQVPPYGAGFAQPPPNSHPNAYPSVYPPNATTVYPSNPSASYFPSSNSQHYLPRQQGYSAYGPSYFRANPTVVPVPNFDPTVDAKKLRKAMKGCGTDEDALINIICHRSNEQRQIIKQTYNSQYGRDLTEDVSSETSGNFEKLLVALLTPIVDFYVKELNDAMTGVGTDEDVLIEILCTMSNYEIHAIKQAYERLYGKSLENELMSEASGYFRKLLVSLCAGCRDESGFVDGAAAVRDANELLRAGEMRIGTDESTFNMIFCQRNFAQIKLICDEYQKLTGHGLEKAIKNEFSGDIEDGLIAILQCSTNKAEFFAKRLHNSMAGIGTDDNQLIRLVVTRCEIDLNDIKIAFERMYGKSLRSWIKGDTSGHYKHALYALIGE